MSFFITHREDVYDQPWSNHLPTVGLYERLKAFAVHKSGYYSGVYLEVGQVLFGQREWADKMGATHRNIRTAINNLKSTHHVTIKKTQQQKHHHNHL